MTHNLQKYYMRVKRSRLSENFESSCSTEQGFSDSQEEILFILKDNHCSDISTDNTSQNDLQRELPEIINRKSMMAEDFNPKCETDTGTAFQKARPDACSYLKNWALKYNVSHVALNELLKYFRIDYPQLPSDARTVLGTCRGILTRFVDPGEYYHFGVKNCIEDLLSKSLPFDYKNSIELDINIDGLPLAKSSSSQVYPILCKINGTNNVEMIGIYHGYEKPKNANEFLSDFVRDISDVINKGIIINGCQLTVNIKSFICDAPAKSFITYTKGHSGYASCSKCHTEGDYLNNRVCFPETQNIHLRTDEDFRMQIQESHHIGTSILENIPGIDMVKCFPLDYMHLLCLGVVKKMLLVLWCQGKPSTKLSFQTVTEISESLVSLSNDIPSEFNRKPRSLNEIKRWKATEFRQFLFYTGPIVLKGKISDDRYLNFLTLYVASVIVSSSKHFQHLDYAVELFQYFVETFKILYGSEHISHNVHNLLHICEDVRNLGPLQNFSAFPFENYLQTILKSLRKSDKPLSQIIKRHSEKIQLTTIPSSIYQYPFYQNEHNNGPILSKINATHHQYRKIVFKEFSLQIREPNNCCALLNGCIICIKNIVFGEGKHAIIGSKVLVLEDFFINPCPSSNIGIFSTNADLGSLEIFDISEISHKCLKLKHGNKFIIIPLLHTQ